MQCVQKRGHRDLAFCFVAGEVSYANMNKQVAVFASLFVFVLIGGIFFYTKTLKTPDVPTPTADSSVVQWVTYENTKYHYMLSYPADGRVMKINEEEPVGDAESLAVEISGGKSLVVVKVQPLPAHLPSYAHISEEYAQSISLDLKSFAEYGRNAEMKYLSEHKTTYNSNLNPGGIQSAFIGEQPAYGFSVNGYSEAWPLGGFEGPSLSGINNYYVLQNSEGDKFVVAYPANDPIAQKIVDSFTFTVASTTAR